MISERETPVRLERVFLSGGGVFSSFVSRKIAELRSKKLEFRGFATARDFESIRQVSLAKAAHLREIDFLISAAERMTDVSCREELFCAVQELLANLLGSECFVIFEKSGNGYRQVARSGILRAIVPDELESGDPSFLALDTRDGSGSKLQPKLILPLLFGNAVVGLLVLYEFLPQKKELNESDDSLLRLIQCLCGSGLVAFAI